MNEINSKNYYCFMIIGSNGSVVYYRNLSKKCNLRSNDLDAIGPVLHVINAQTSQVTPPCLQKNTQKDEAFCEVIDHRLECINCNNFQQYLWTTLSNIKFILISSGDIGARVKGLFKQIYAVYADCISKMAMRDDSQPFQNATFDKEISQFFSD